ncbi:MAG: histidine kinase sensor domain-containing protein, partial [Pontibacterium sp.]
MSRKLFWQLNISVLVVAIAMFYGLHFLSATLSNSLTKLGDDDQAELLHYASQAQTHWLAQDDEGILQVTTMIGQRWGVWSGVVTSDYQVHTHLAVPAHINLGFQRDYRWPVHHFMKNLVVAMPFDDKSVALVVELPEPMYPRVNMSLIHNGLTVVIPSILLSLFCWFAYRYV